MATKRSYEDACGAARALDLIGERWALLVVREMVLGPKRFTDLRTGLPGISPNVLTQRLTELEQDGIVRRRKLPPPASSWVYELTEWGAELGPVIMDLGRWGARSPYLSPDAELSVDSLMISFRTMFDPPSAHGVTARYELRFGDDRFRAEVSAGQLALVRGEAANPDAIIEASTAALAGVVYFGNDLDEALKSGAMKVVGNRAAAQKFFTLFKLPDPVNTPASTPVPAA
jgi:DNA-binding HxlR family transcriptional regulator